MFVNHISYTGICDFSVGCTCKFINIDMSLCLVYKFSVGSLNSNDKYFMHIQDDI